MAKNKGKKQSFFDGLLERIRISGPVAVALLALFAFLLLSGAFTLFKGLSKGPIYFTEATAETVCDVRINIRKVFSPVVVEENPVRVIGYYSVVSDGTDYILVYFTNKQWKNYGFDKYFTDADNYGGCIETDLDLSGYVAKTDAIYIDMGVQYYKKYIGGAGLPTDSPLRSCMLKLGGNEYRGNARLQIFAGAMLSVAVLALIVFNLRKIILKSNISK